MRYGDILDHTYQIMEKLGSGGGGVVYKAFHIRMKKYVVVKEIRSDTLGQLEARGEVDILKNLHHANLPQVYDFFETGERVFSVMEYIDGQSLEECLNEGWSFPEEQLVKWLRQIGSALEYLHGQKPPIFHCDVKPANIMLDHKGDAFLIDFNISLQEGQERLLGLSRQYASPEQLHKAGLQEIGGDYQSIVIDGRTDIYSLGAVFYKLMTGCVPQGDAIIPAGVCHIQYSSGLLKVIGKALRTDPPKRYHSAGQMLAAVQHMERLDEDYIRTGILYGCGLALCALGAAVGIWLAAAGLQQNRQASYRRDVRLLMEYLEGPQAQELVSLGEEMLESRAYREYFQKHPEEKAQVLYAMGTGYRREGSSLMAAWYLGKAVAEAGESNKLPGYYRDYVAVLLGRGDQQGAQAALEQAQKDGVTSDCLKLLEGDILAAQEAWEEACESYLAAVSLTGDSRLKADACLRAADCFGKSGSEEDCISMLEEAERFTTDRNLSRQLAEAYLKYSTDVNYAENAAYYRQKAIACYERLNAMGNPAFLDRLNLAVLYLADGQAQSARARLEELISTGDYRVYMYLAYADYQLYTRDSGQTGKADELLSNYKKAEKAYREAKSPDDENMEQLRLLVKEMGL